MNDLGNLLDKYKIDQDDREKIAEQYKQGIEDVLRSRFSREGTDVSIQYGGSLKKGTANSTDCDLDILCYVDSDSDLSVEEIYNIANEELTNNGYTTSPKNSAIKVTQKSGDPSWDMTIDVVPGKYFSNNTDDVWLWQNKDRCKLKTNPVKQIGKVRHSSSRDVIRLIKLYRYFNGFSFKSFFLENFCIDIVEPDFEEGDDLQDKLIKFCRHYQDIGIRTIYDPANSSNDIMKMHSEDEFKEIRQRIHNLLEALLTDDPETYINCLLGKHYDVEEGYRRNAFFHSHFDRGYRGNFITLKYKNGSSITENDAIPKASELEFSYTIYNHSATISWRVSNGGYEARKANQLRGGDVQTDYRSKRGSVTIYSREEHTAYYGDHYVQAFIKYSNGEIETSAIRKVKVR